MSKILRQLVERLAQMSPEEKEAMRRAITGEADDDIIRRGDALDAIRSMMSDPVPSFEVQRGIQMALGAVSGMSAHDRP